MVLVATDVLYRNEAVNVGNKADAFYQGNEKTHTILLPQMLEYHSPFLQAVFEANGYHFAVLQGGSHLKERALRCINNDYCYPGILIVGQMLEALQEGHYSADNIAFMEPQAGGACRAGNYYQVIINALNRCGYGCGAGLSKCADCPSFRVSGQPCVRTGYLEAVKGKISSCKFPNGGV